jgi:magnesium transporter
MRRTRARRSEKTGLPPGTLVHIGHAKAERVVMHLLDYDAERLQEKQVERVEEVEPLRGGDGILWLDVSGLHDADLLGKIGQLFGLHPLLMEDVLNTEQRPKLEDYDDYLFVVLKRLHYHRRSGQVMAEQVSLVLGQRFVLSFRETEGSLYEPVRQRIRGTKGRLRRLGPDFLVHALIDGVVDEYFGVVEAIGEEIEQLEEQILDRPTPVAMRSLHRLKGELIALRKSVWPLREVISGLDRCDSELLTQALDVYLRDVYDHTIHVVDTVETYRDLLSGMLDVYLSALSNRMNEIMKVLTIISTIFIPLTFIAGVYGMNFKYMPELEWHWGYFGVMGLMLAIALGLLALFRRKRWL